jgi:hypothetical protein
MKSKLLVTAALGAALTLAPMPATAQHVRPHAVGMGVPNAKLPDGSVNRAHRFGRTSLDGTAVAWGYDLQSSYDDRDWAPNSGNDWWNTRTDRAYPRWVQEQRGQACAPERMWWSGTGWHC